MHPPRDPSRAGRLRRRRTTGRVVASLLLGGSVLGVAPAHAAGSRADGPHVTTWWGDVMHLDQVHRRATGKGVVIALLDAGLQPGVPALKGADVEMSTSPCLYGKRGHDKATYESTPDAVHGSQMASLLVGGGNGPGGPGTGVMGVAPDATLRFYDVSPIRGNDPKDITCDSSTIVDTVARAIKDGADVVSLSFGGGQSVADDDWARLAQRNRAVIVASSIAKSDDTLTFEPPAGVPGIVSVNALDRDYSPWKQSLTLIDREQGSETEGWYTPAISAPGVDIDAEGTALGYGPGAYVTGTSPAAALVAGSVAVVKEKYPDATPSQLVQNLVHHTTRDNLTGAKRIRDMTWGLNTGFGPVSPLNMLTHDPAGWPDENPLMVDPTTVAATYPSSIEGQKPTATPTASASPSQAGQEKTSAPTDASTAASSPADSGSTPWVWVVLGIALLVLLAAGLVFTRRRRLGDPPPISQDDHRDLDRDVHDTDHQPAGGQ